MSSTKVKGDHNVIVGQDLTIYIGNDHKTTIPNLVEQFYEKIEKLVAEKIEEGILKAGTDKRVPFKIRKIVYSLSLIGVPPEVILEVVAQVSSKLLNEYKHNKNISTTLVRDVIAETLYGLDESKYSTYKVQRWGDNYVRRYGSEYRVKVITEGEKELDYNFLKKEIIPTVLSEIAHDISYLVEAHRLPSNSTIEKMAEEILSIISGLNLYRIHYNTLLSIVRELCLQPPHPWFATSIRDFKYVHYDYIQYKINFKKAKFYFDKCDYGKALYALKEFIHHSCSCILCYYTVYMGCGTLAPLYVLLDIVKQLIYHNDQRIDMMFKIRELKDDLNRNGMDLNTFYMILCAIKSRLHHVKIADDKSCKELNKSCNQLYDIATNLVGSFIRLNKLQSVKTKKLSERQINHILLDIFTCFPKLNWEIYKPKKAYWIIHNYDHTIFRMIKPFILIVPYLTDYDNVNLFVTNWINEVKKNENISNSLIFISREKADSLIKCHEKSDAKGIFIFSFSLDTLIDIVSQSDPIKYIEKIFRQQLI